MLSCSYLGPNGLHVSDFLDCQCFPLSQKRVTNVLLQEQQVSCLSASHQVTANTLTTSPSPHTPHLSTVNSTDSWVVFTMSGFYAGFPLCASNNHRDRWSPLTHKSSKTQSLNLSCAKLYAELLRINLDAVPCYVSSSSDTGFSLLNILFLETPS